MRGSVVAALAAVVVAVPIVTFWLVGDQSATDDPVYLDYIWRASVSESAVRVFGIAALIVLLVASAYLLRAMRPLRQHGHVLRAVLMLVLAGEIGAVGVRVLTAGTRGANIGGGLFLILGLPVSVVLVASATRAFTSRSAMSLQDRPLPDEGRDPAHE